jgi:xanthine dehydrogenase YagR molybdenum-binding subunit
MRQEKFPFGIAGVSVGEIERQVPAGEAPPLPTNDRLAVIGKSVPRINGRAKVTGAARFTVDIKLPGMLHARLLRSPHAHAHIVSIDTQVAERNPDVRAVHVITDVVGRAIERDAGTDHGAGVHLPPALYVGAPIAAVAAITEEAVDAALGLIKVDYEVLPFVVDMEDARKPDAPAVFASPVIGTGFEGRAPGSREIAQHGNIRGPVKAGARGDIDAGFAEAEVVVEEDYRTQVQTHCCMETHSVVADWRPDGLTIYLSTQFTAGVRNELAEAFKLPRNRVRVVVDAMGGGFGSKSSAGNYARAAVALSRAAAAPVRLSARGTARFGQQAGDIPAPEDRRAQGWPAERHLALYLRDGRNRHRRRRRQCRAGHVRMPEFRQRAIRRLHQCGTRLRNARSGQYAWRLCAGTGHR